MSGTLLEGTRPAAPETDPEVISLGEGRMVREDCWREVHRLFHVERRSKSEIARQLALDRKTVRGILHEGTWQPYARAERTDTLLAEHVRYLQSRAPQVQYSARILFQELRQGRGYGGSYETVKRFVRPLRAVEEAAERATVRFETAPGQQSQIDWGQARSHFRSRPIVLHVFILTLGSTGASSRTSAGPIGRWQPASAGPDDRVCLLDVPAHKTGTPFTKPVDPLVGQAIDAWEAVRPRQPLLVDRRTGERVAVLFCLRAKRVARDYFNHALIPALCRKAGVPRTDARGRITSHRARSTIASQLYNAKEPMTLFELQAWLGHRSPQSTQHYTQITPTRLVQAYADAGYFSRNLRTIEVLIDREAVATGATAAGTPWQYYDLGHGYCTYNFFEQCPHRMACARCDFYLPKASSRAQLLEAKTSLQRMLATIPLTDDERAAVDDGASAVDRLLARLADVPTPTGTLPQEAFPSTALLTINPRQPRGSLTS